MKKNDGPIIRSPTLNLESVVCILCSADPALAFGAALGLLHVSFPLSVKSGHAFLGVHELLSCSVSSDHANSLM